MLDNKTAGQKMAAEITALIKARAPLLWVVSPEETRAERGIIDAASAIRGMNVRLWDCVSGVTDGAGADVEIDRISGRNYKDCGQVLAAITASKERAVWVLRDLHKWFQLPDIPRALRNLAHTLSSAPLNQHRAVIILTPSGDVPPDLANDVILVRWPMPDRAEIGVLLDRVVEGAPEPLATELRLSMMDGGRDAALEAALGLTAEGAAICYTKSIVTSKRIVPADVAAEKKRVINQSKGIEWTDPDPRGLDAVGGLDLLKPWLLSRSVGFSQEARDFGLPSPKGMLLVGVPGCLAAGTRIEYLRGERVSGAGRYLPIEVFHDKFNGIENPRGGGRAYGGSKWQPDLPTYLQSWDPRSRKIVHNEVTAVMNSGVKPCIRVTTADAGSVVLTVDHPILTTDGVFKKAADISPGDTLTVRGSMKPQNERKKRVHNKKGRVITEGLKYHPYAWRKVVNDKKTGKRYEYQRITRARLVIEAGMNSLPFQELVRILKYYPAHAETLRYLSMDFDVHHKDEDPSNDDPSNLMVVDHDEHARHHGEDGTEDHFGIEHTATTVVLAIEPVDFVQTYDIEMTEEVPNFVVNDGIIVHNCGKSLTAKATAAAFQCPLLRLDMGAAQSKWVGESQQNIRGALAVAETVGKCVLWIDEIEKALAGATSGAADGGVSADALGTLLSWMQERKGSVFVIATANDVTKLPPELLRKGRWDDLFFVDLPTSRERLEILRVAVKKYGRNLDVMISATPPANRDAEDALVEATADFTGAEIEALIEPALYAAFADGKRALRVDDLMKAARETTPLARTAQEKVEALRSWAKGRARPSSLPEEKRAASTVRVLDLSDDSSN